MVLSISAISTALRRLRARVTMVSIRASPMAAAMRGQLGGMRKAMSTASPSDSTLAGAPSTASRAAAIWASVRLVAVRSAIRVRT